MTPNTVKACRYCGGGGMCNGTECVVCLGTGKIAFATGQQELFDFEEGMRQKQEGMTRAELNVRRSEALRLAREMARACALSRWDRVATADDAYRALAEEQRFDLGPAAGSIFRGNEWEWTGKWLASVRVSNHGRMIRVWRLA